MHNTQSCGCAAESSGQAMGDPGPGGAPFQGPTPYPFPHAAMMGGPSVHPQGPAGPGPAVGHPGMGQDHTAHAGRMGGAGHPGGGSFAFHPGYPQGAAMNHPPLHEAYQYGRYPQAMYPGDPGLAAQDYSVMGLNFGDGNFWKGALVGAAVALLVTSETFQRALMKGVATAYSAATDAMGELKEKFEDAQAELRQTKE